MHIRNASQVLIFQGGHDQTTENKVKTKQILIAIRIKNKSNFRKVSTTVKWTKSAYVKTQTIAEWEETSRNKAKTFWIRES